MWELIGGIILGLGIALIYWLYITERICCKQSYHDTDDFCSICGNKLKPIRIKIGLIPRKG